MVFICFPLMIGDIEHLFMCLLVITISSLEKYIFIFSAHFLIGLFIYLMLSCMSSLYILDIKPLLVISLASTFSHSVGSLFILLMLSLEMLFSKIYFCSSCPCLRRQVKKMILILISKNLLPMFSSTNFVVSGCIYVFKPC